MEQDQPNPASFSPSGLGVTVNALWVLSLSLSVSVSVVIMLAKEWCYNFMSGRNGPIYDQARRRHQKWIGIEKWRMRELMTYLPFVMHAALLLFAVGLCIYLWAIRIAVAIPAIIITLLTTGFYGTATILPIVDRYCPYSTPVVPTVAKLVHAFGEPLAGLVEWLYHKSPNPMGLRGGLKRFHTTLEHLRGSIPSREAVTGSGGIPLDLVTSHMLAWIIANCEDSRSVDIALQAIGGAGGLLPMTPLMEINAKSLLNNRIDQMNRASNNWGSTKVSLRVALRYVRSYTTLAPMDHDTQGRHHIIPRSSDVICGLMEQILPVLPTNLPLMAAASVLSSYSLARARGAHYDQVVCEDAILRPVIFALADHARKGSTVEDFRLGILLDSVQDYLVQCWSRKSARQDNGLLAVLAIIYHKGVIASKFQSTIAITLAEVAHGCKGWPPYQHNQLQSALGEHQTENNDETRDMLFAMGILKLFPEMDLWQLHVAIGYPFYWACYRVWDYYGYRASSSSLHHHRLESFGQVLMNIALVPPQISDDSLVRLLEEMYDEILGGSFVQQIESEAQLYVPALIALRHTRSTLVREQCIRILDAQQAVLNLEQVWDIFTRWAEAKGKIEDLEPTSTLLSDLELPDTRLIHISSFYFRSLIANTMLSTTLSLEQRQAKLWPMLHCRDEFSRPAPFVTKLGQLPPTIDRILSHVAQDVSEQTDLECILETMELVAEFCEADPSAEQAFKRSQAGSRGEHAKLESPDWTARLETIKADYRRQISILDRAPVEGEIDDTISFAAPQSEGLVSGDEAISEGPIEVVVHGLGLNDVKLGPSA
ncbi:anaphase-promoting complex subunit 2 [Ceratobasidium sp. AG-Ba]|nr:anaphase-promoting complex subunit 2 [Ceratobasidium sp. AG-Ba]